MNLYPYISKEDYDGLYDHIKKLYKEFKPDGKQYLLKIDYELIEKPKNEGTHSKELMKDMWML